MIRSYSPPTPLKKSPHLRLALCVCLCGILTNCGKQAPAQKNTPSADTPILRVSKGDAWHYQVRTRIPAGVTAPGSAEVDVSYERVRRFIGKIIPAEGLPEVDCFEVTNPGSPVEREFVEIHDDRILMRGSLIMRPEATQPLWLEPAVPFIIAGLRPGDKLPDVEAVGGSRTRTTVVVAREEITVPPGTFRTIRLLMTGEDGRVKLRRTLWFAPGHGLIREESSRSLDGTLLREETSELTALKRAG